MRAFGNSLVITAVLLAAISPARAGEVKSAATASGTASAVAKTAPATIQWFNFDQGLTKARKEKKLVLLDFTAAWCGWCKKMERETFPDAELIKFIRANYVAVKVWGDNKKPEDMVSLDGQRMTQQELTRMFNVSGYPMFAIIDASGKQFLGPYRDKFLIPYNYTDKQGNTREGRMDPFSGYKRVQAMLSLLEYVKGEHYTTTPYAEFLQKKYGTEWMGVLSPG